VKIIIGLGNPGTEYAKTRHNVGFMAIDRLQQRWAPGEIARSRFSGLTVECAVKGVKTLLVKPLTYMNRSGQTVSQVVGFYKAEIASDLLVLVDEAAINCGSIKLRPSGSDGGHNGLADIQRALGTEAYPRLRIGIGPRPPMVVLHDFVLGRFSESDWPLVQASIEKTCDAVETFVAQGLDAAMNKFNRKDDLPPPSPVPPATSNTPP
jgi:PTH1 family peptidyl-tRNA hydrolase